MKGWAAVFATVSAVDAHALITGNPTLSSSFKRASREHPYLLIGATAYLVAHLFGLVPRTVDPLQHFGGN